jgi:hypothetical protein
MGNGILIIPRRERIEERGRLVRLAIRAMNLVGADPDGPAGI